jgi:hypothetical protein
LMTTGENSTTWGNVTNINLGTALEEAIAGSADVAFTSANVTLTLTDTNSTQTARNLRLNLTGTATAGYNLVVPAIEKAYIVNNGTDGTVTVKNATGANVAVPTGKTTWVYNTGSNVVDAVTHLTSLTLASALPVASGGTGANTAATARTALSAAASGANNDITSLTGLTAATGSGNVVLATSPTLVTPTLVTPALGTPASGVVTNLTGTASININGTVGATTPTTGAFTLLKGTSATTTTNTTITPTSDTTNQYTVTALGSGATIAAPSGSPIDGQKLIIRIKDNGTARALTWNATYTVRGTTLPTTTVVGETLYVGCIYNSAASVWDVVAVTSG